MVLKELTILDGTAVSRRSVLWMRVNPTIPQHMSKNPFETAQSRLDRSVISVLIGLKAGTVLRDWAVSNGFLGMCWGILGFTLSPSTDHPEGVGVGEGPNVTLNTMYTDLVLTY
ncbi:hypothetical protein I4U23_016880 [Adineta vaga]|nr:hypothetical protein I4U23_016880 [Adineta vaga]